MAKAKTQETTDKINGEFVSVFRSSDFTFESVKVTIKDGCVVSTELLTRAPDMSQVAIGRAQAYLWRTLVKQTKKEVLADVEATKAVI